MKSPRYFVFNIWGINFENKETEDYKLFFEEEKLNPKDPSTWKPLWIEMMTKHMSLLKKLIVENLGREREKHIRFPMIGFGAFLTQIKKNLGFQNFTFY